METNELKLRQYVKEVAILELPVIKLLVALQVINGGEIPTDATLGGVIDYYIDKIDGISEIAKDETQENYDSVYDMFVKLIDEDTHDVIYCDDDNEGK